MPATERRAIQARPKATDAKRPRNAEASRGRSRTTGSPDPRTTPSRPLRDPIPFLVLELSAHEHDQVDEHPDPEAAERDELKDACPDLADVEAVRAEHAEEEAEQSGGQDALVGRELAWQRLHHAARRAHDGLRVDHAVAGQTELGRTRGHVG